MEHKKARIMPRSRRRPPALFQCADGMARIGRFGHRRARRCAGGGDGTRPRHGGGGVGGEGEGVHAGRTDHGADDGGPGPPPGPPPDKFLMRVPAVVQVRTLHEPPPLYRAGASQITQAAVIQSINPAVNSQCLLALPSVPQDRRIADRLHLRPHVEFTDAVQAILVVGQ